MSAPVPIFLHTVVKRSMQVDLRQVGLWEINSAREFGDSACGQGEFISDLTTDLILLGFRILAQLNRIIGFQDGVGVVAPGAS
jgi:hypothetical protein